MSLFLKSIKPALINSKRLQEQIFVRITSGKMFKKLRGKKKPVQRKQIQNVQNSQKYKIKHRKKHFPLFVIIIVTTNVLRIINFLFL